MYGTILYLHMSLLEQRVVAVSGRVGDLRALCSALGSEALVENDAARPRLVVDEDLIAEFVDELIEADIVRGLVIPNVLSSRRLNRPLKRQLPFVGSVL